MFKPVAIVEVVDAQQRREWVDVVVRHLLERIFHADKGSPVRIRLLFGRRARGSRLSRQLGHRLQGLIG